MDEFYSDDHARGDGAATTGLLPSGIRGAVSAAVFVGLVAAMGVWAYRLGTRDATEVPVIRAMQGPSRVAPEDPGGFQAANQGHEINRVFEGAPAPAPRKAVVVEAAASLADEDKPQSELAQASQSQAVAEMVEQAAQDAPLNDAEAGDAVALVEPAPDLGGAAMAEAEADEPEREKPVAAFTGPRPISRPSNLVRVSARAKAPAAPAAQAKTAAVKPVAANAAPAAPATPQIREVASVSSGTRMVQLGAFDSEANTRAAWQRLVAANNDLLSSKSLYVERATSNARVFYRLRVAGFQNTDQTRQLCESLRARSIDCIPVTIR